MIPNDIMISDGFVIHEVPAPAAESHPMIID